MNKVKKWFYKKRVLLCITFLIILSVLLVKQIQSFYRYYNTFNFPGYEASILHQAIEDHDYPSLLEKVSHNEGSSKDTVSDTTEYAALAKYYQAAIYYKAYLDKDQTEADKYLHTMTENEEKIKSDIMRDELNKLKQFLHL